MEEERCVTGNGDCCVFTKTHFFSSQALAFCMFPRIPSFRYGHKIEFLTSGSGNDLCHFPADEVRRK